MLGNVTDHGWGMIVTLDTIEHGFARALIMAVSPERLVFCVFWLAPPKLHKGALLC